MSAATSLLELSPPVDPAELAETARLSHLVADAVRAAQLGSVSSQASAASSRSARESAHESAHEPAHEPARSDASIADRLERARLEARSLTAARRAG